MQPTNISTSSQSTNTSTTITNVTNTQTIAPAASTAQSDRTSCISTEQMALVPQQQQQHREESASSFVENITYDSSQSETGQVRYGKCKWFNVAKGWGFITPHDGGQEVFVHQSVIQMSGFRSLGEQEEVEFECQLTERGLEATRVSGKKGLDCTGSTFRPHTKKRRRVRCYNCGKFANHIASMCPQEPQPKRCHLCKAETHFFADCPTRLDPSTSAELG
ncbi:protein lin-28 homolog [Eurosta solidaginis]|uniref:protein lin-28 homolog n=1 Tax=Eurosta solidaginis TaxID=178769 RepID=UPI003530E712